MTTTTTRNPNTGGRWTFPKDATRYASRIHRCYDPPACEHGHFGCALWEDGPCMDEQLARSGYESDR